MLPSVPETRPRPRCRARPLAHSKVDGADTPRLPAPRQGWGHSGQGPGARPGRLPTAKRMEQIPSGCLSPAGAGVTAAKARVLGPAAGPGCLPTATQTEQIPPGCLLPFAHSKADGTDPPRLPAPRRGWGHSGQGPGAGPSRSPTAKRTEQIPAGCLLPAGAGVTPAKAATPPRPIPGFPSFRSLSFSSWGRTANVPALSDLQGSRLLEYGHISHSPGWSPRRPHYDNRVRGL